MSSLSALGPATSSAEGVRDSWGSSAAFERAGLSRLLSPGEKRPVWVSGSLENSSVVRFLKALPFEAVSIGPKPRLPYERDPVMGLVFVHRFGSF